MVGLRAGHRVWTRSGEEEERTADSERGKEDTMKTPDVRDLHIRDL